MSNIKNAAEARPIYIMDDRHTSVRLRRRLRQIGFEPQPWPGMHVALPAIPRLFDFTRSAVDDLALRSEDINIVFCDNESTDFKPPENADIIIRDLRQLETLSARLNLSLRERRQTREKHLRQQTMERLTPHTAPLPQRQTKRLLWLGPHASFLNPLKASLKAEQVELWAAISAYTARDYLSSQTFDLVGLYPKQMDDEAMRLLQYLMTLPQPHAWRKVLVLEPETNQIVSGQSADAADMIIDSTADIAQMSAKIAALAHSDAATVNPQTSPYESAKPILNTLATRDYLESHISAQMMESDASREPLTIVALRVPHTRYVDKLIDTVLPLLRESDLAARIESQIVALSLPGTNFRGGSKLVKRIQSELGFEINPRIIQRRDYHNARTIIGGLTAMTGLRRQPIIG